MSLSLQEYYDYLTGISIKRQAADKQVKKIDKASVKKIKPKIFTTKKR